MPMSQTISHQAHTFTSPSGRLKNMKTLVKLSFNSKHENNSAPQHNLNRVTELHLNTSWYTLHPFIKFQKPNMQREDLEPKNSHQHDLSTQPLRASVSGVRHEFAK